MNFKRSDLIDIKRIIRNGLALGLQPTFEGLNAPIAIVDARTRAGILQVKLAKTQRWSTPAIDNHWEVTRGGARYKGVR